MSMITAISRGKYPFIVSVIVLPPGLKYIRPRANGRNIVGQQLPTLLDVTCCVPFAHPVACCCVLLESVAQSSRAVKLFTRYKRTQQLPTFLGRRVGSCFVLSQVALNYTGRAKLDRYLRTRAGDSRLKTLKAASVLHMYLVYLNLIRVLTYVYS